MSNIDSPIPAIPPLAEKGQQITPEPTDRWSALKQIGWWKPIDTTILAVILAHLVTAVFFVAFGRMTYVVATVGLLQILVLLCAWCVMLLYRCMDFVIQLRASVEMIPFDSARIALGYMQGGKQ